MQGMPSGAVDAFTSSLLHVRDHPALLSRRAESYNQLGRLDEALADANTAITVTKASDPMLLKQRAQLLYCLKRPTEAVVDFEAATAKAVALCGVQEQADVLFHQGVVRANLDDHAGALICWRDALELLNRLQTLEPLLSLISKKVASDADDKPPTLAAAEADAARRKAAAAPKPRGSIASTASGSGLHIHAHHHHHRHHGDGSMVPVLPLSDEDIAAQLLLPDGPQRVADRIFAESLAAATAITKSIEESPVASPLTGTIAQRATRTDFQHHVHRLVLGMTKAAANPPAVILRFRLVYESACSLQMLGHHEDAVTHFTLALAFAPHFAHAFFRRGFSNKALKRYFAAADDFETARELAPADARYRLNYHALHEVSTIAMDAAGSVSAVDIPGLGLEGLHTLKAVQSAADTVKAIVKHMQQLIAEQAEADIAERDKLLGF